MYGVNTAKRCPARKPMETWVENVCGVDIKMGLRTERIDENAFFRTCPPGEIITVCFAHYGYKMPSYSVRFNTLTDATTLEDAVRSLIEKHGTKGRWWGFVDEF